jgi:DNA-binding GntR family transcriptional regulator
MNIGTAGDRGSHTFHTKKDYAVERIRELIFAGELHSGERLLQAKLAQRLGLGLTPVREALLQLQAEGLVDGRAHMGVTVSSADIGSVSGIYIVRRLLETYAAARAAPQLSGLALVEARGWLRELEDANRRGDPRGVRRANNEFHFTLYGHCGVPEVVELILGLWARFPWDVLSVVPGRIQQSRREHRAILSGMVSRDPEATAKAVETHLVNSYSTVATYLNGGSETVDPFLLTGVGDSGIK